MAGKIEEPLRFNFQADLLHSGSISFGRFESESLSWERRSSFSHNRYLEEVEKYSKPGSVTEKKAYFEAHFRRKALLKQSSSENQDERELPASENDDLHDLQESENGNDSKHFTCFDESPHSSGHFRYNKETEIEICVNPNIESLRVDQTISDPDHLKLEETHQTETANVNLVKSEEITEVTLYDSVVKVDVASETKHPKPKPKGQTNITRVSRIISSEASNVTSKTKTREIKGSPKVKKSTRPASAISHSGRKTSKSEESSTSFPKAKLPPPNKSIVKESRPEKSLQRARETINRTKSTVISPSKPHAANQTATGFNFKSDQRAERRKEEKRAAAETTQSRKNLNFKATPMPSFYKESVRSLDHSKVTSASKTPNRPRTASMAPSTKKVLTNSASSSNPRPSSSTSVTNRSRLPEPSRKVQDKKKDLNLSKQKQHEAIIGSRVRETKGVHTGPGLKPGYLPVRVAT
ncbi:protein WVD2-like 7 [Bidens hawaiensis]|uniref:protein WVD2-like 7 n=1 Tax=Bidens hawaiensis TaxID=980011 RepID=UPI00404B1A90